jgi:hypothetical protein
MVDTVERIERQAPYLEARNKALLDQLFGEFDEETGNFSGGILDPESFPDLFKIPEYKMAGQYGRDEEGNITGAQYDEDGNLIEGTGIGAETFATQLFQTDENKDGIPDFLGRYQDYFDQSEDLLGIGEGADGAKQQFDAAGDVLADAKSYYGDVGEGDTAVDLLRSGTGMYDPSSGEYGVDKFMSGYDDNVLAQVEKDIERQGDVSRKKAADQAIAAGAFGGSRQGIQAAEVERNIADAKAKASANLRQQAYDKALAASQTAFEKGQTRGLEAGRLMGGLGQSYGGIGTAMGGLGGQMSGAAGTSADIGRVYGAMSPADLEFMRSQGELERQYRQDQIDTGRLEDMRLTEEYLYPIQVGMNFMTGNPAANLSSTYSNTYAQQPGVADAMMGGIGAYTTMQGIARS